MQTLILIVLILIPSIAVYYLVPNLLVRRFGVDYKKYEKEAKKGRFVKVEPNHALMAVRGGTKVRALIGANYKLAKRPAELSGTDGLWVVPRKSDESEEIGAKLDTLVWFLDTWIHLVTGYRVIGASVADLFNAKLASYNLARPGSMRNTTPKDVDDVSYFVMLNKQVVKYNVEKANTGGITTLNINGKTIEYQSAVEVNQEGQVTVIVANLDMAFFGVDKYFDNLLMIVRAALVEAVRGSTAETLRDQDWVRNNIDPAPLLKNGAIPVELQAIFEPLFEIKPDHLGPEFVARWDRERVIPGTFLKFGVLVTGSRNDQLEFDAKFNAFIEAQQKAALEARANLTTSEVGIQIATNKRMAREQDALGEAAVTKKELEALTDGAEALVGKLSNPGLATTVLVAQQHSRAVRDSKGGQIFVNAGGIGSNPTPVVPLAQPATGGANP